jgi:hypothetical protein
MAVPLPPLDAPVIDLQTGLMTQIWYDYFSRHQRLTQLSDVSPAPPANGNTVRWNSTSRLWIPGV